MVVELLGRDTTAARSPVLTIFRGGGPAQALSVRAEGEASGRDRTAAPSWRWGATLTAAPLIVHGLRLRWQV